MKIRHLYDWREEVVNETLHGSVIERRKHPVATLVQLDTGNIGVSVCSDRDSFNKALGREIAEGRALAGTQPKQYRAGWQDRVIQDPYGNEVTLGRYVEDSCQAMSLRFERAEQFV